MDTRFSAAIHTLILIANAEAPKSSEAIADSVGTNASYIRKLTGLLKKHGILDSRQGVCGFSLTKKPEELSLLEIYQAVSESEEVHVFDLHQNPNDLCIIGRHIRPVLTDVFREIEEKAQQELQTKTLADCIREMKAEIERKEK